MAYVNEQFKANYIFGLYFITRAQIHKIFVCSCGKDWKLCDLV